MYFIKTKGTSKVPDFLQLRDENFLLVEQIKLTNLSPKLKVFYGEKTEMVIELIKNSEFDKIIEINI